MFIYSYIVCGLNCLKCGIEASQIPPRSTPQYIIVQLASNDSSSYMEQDPNLQICGSTRYPMPPTTNLASYSWLPECIYGDVTIMR